MSWRHHPRFPVEHGDIILCISVNSLPFGSAELDTACYCRARQYLDIHLSRHWPLLDGCRTSTSDSPALILPHWTGVRYPYRFSPTRLTSTSLRTITALTMGKEDHPLLNSPPQGQEPNERARTGTLRAVLRFVVATFTLFAVWSLFIGFVNYTRVRLILRPYASPSH